MSNVQTGAQRMPHDLSHLGFLAGQIGRLITISTTPVIAGDSFEMDAVGALRLSPLRRGLAIEFINSDEVKVKEQELFFNQDGTHRWHLVDERDGGIDSLKHQIELFPFAASLSQSRNCTAIGCWSLCSTFSIVFLTLFLFKFS